MVAANRQRPGRPSLVNDDYAMPPLRQVDPRNQAYGTGAHHEDIADSLDSYRHQETSEAQDT